ncbi:MAG: acetylxylan esterase [Spirochaetes bacterium]|nr:acetylxylan esterase [Spirochaetota bacterium]MBL7006234.1 acetylxylan esterase [Spirochaetia bacterium]
MPQIDMPLDELKRYEGINPKPDDFDEYWDRALSELETASLDIELRPASFNVSFAECFDLYFTGVGGSRIHAKYIRPKTAVSTKHPAVIEFHGYSGNAGDWADKLKWTAAGYSSLAMDVRGQGGTSQDLGGITGTTLRGHIIRGIEDNPDNLLFKNIFLDTAQLARITMQLPEVDPKRVGVYGGSQGGALTLACASLVPEIQKAAPLYPFLSDYKRVWEMDLAKDAYDEINFYFRRFDPMHLREKELFTTLGYIDIQNLTPRIQAEVLQITGLMDTICPPSTQFAAYNKIRSKKNMLIYPDFGHENIQGSSDKIYEFMMSL